MKRIILFSAFALAVFITSCTKLAHLYETKSMTDTSNQENLFENDTVRIVYSFWSEGGSFSFSIYNKLNKPLYIDWKRSSFIKNNDKLNYWSDEVLTKSTSKKSTVYYYGFSLLSAESGVSSSVKPEQVTFIAPKSTVYKIQFNLNEKLSPKLPKVARTTIVPRSDKSKNTTKVSYIDFVENNTPLSFRNFMTLSTSDKFTNEFYIDNGFYLSKVIQMPLSQLTGSSTSSGLNLMKVPSPYKDKMNFYVLVVK